MFTSSPVAQIAADLTAWWDRQWRERDLTPIPAPPRTSFPPAPTVATLLERQHGRWERTRLTASQVAAVTVPVLDSWQSLDLTSGLYAGGVVVRDVRS